MLKDYAESDSNHFLRKNVTSVLILLLESEMETFTFWVECQC